jgi:hypothetical protein
LWKKGESQEGKVIRAKLGEEKTSFYYDKDLKKWINPKVSVIEFLQ